MESVNPRSELSLEAWIRWVGEITTSLKSVVSQWGVKPKEARNIGLKMS